MDKRSTISIRESDLHPYDGIDQHYQHTDSNPARGLAIVAYKLGLAKTPSPEGLLYDLSIYSGGIGVHDQLAITIPANSDLWAEIIAFLNAREPEDIAKDPYWAEDFLWLLHADAPPSPIREAAMKFVNSARRSFQDECTSSSRVLFHTNSDVNDWIVIWGTDTLLNYLAYSQG